VRIRVLNTLAAVACAGADLICDEVARKPELVLGVATGGSPIPMYRELVGRAQAGRASLESVTLFLLDEYHGLPPDHPQRFRNVIEESLGSCLGAGEARIHGLESTPRDVVAECSRYEARIEGAGGVDLQILGIGENGHLGFNEPGSPLGSRTRLVTLAPSTRLANARFFGGNAADVPERALTQGLCTISQARHLLLLATGTRKAASVRAALEGPVSAELPASVLQLHPEATVLLDRAAASRLGTLGSHVSERVFT